MTKNQPYVTQMLHFVISYGLSTSPSMIQNQLTPNNANYHKSKAISWILHTNVWKIKNLLYDEILTILKMIPFVWVTRSLTASLLVVSLNKSKPRLSAQIIMVHEKCHISVVHWCMLKIALKIEYRMRNERASYLHH